MEVDELILCLKLIGEQFHTKSVGVLDAESAARLLTRLLLGLNTDTRDIYTYIGMPCPGDAIIPEKKRAYSDLASRVVDSDNILFLSSSAVHALLNEENLQDNDPLTWHYLHLLQVKSGWTLTAIGSEDSLFLGDDYTCCIFNGLKNQDIEEMDEILSKYDGFTLTEEVPFRFNQINPLDTHTWRDLRSTPLALGSSACPNDPDDDSWTDDYPIDVSNGSNLDRVYAKLDETTRYKNDLVKKLYDLREQHETLKRQVREMLGDSHFPFDN